MAVNLLASIERMESKLSVIKFHAVKALNQSSHEDYYGARYRILSAAIGKIAVHVRDTMPVRNYWYAKFVEEGVLKPCEHRTASAPAGGVATDRRNSSASEGAGGTGEEVR